MGIVQVGGSTSEGGTPKPPPGSPWRQLEDHMLSPREPLPLPPGELHVWRAPLDRDPEITARLEAVLAEDERERAGRFYHPRHAARFAVGRGLLRVLLGRYLGAAPAEIAFSYGEYGKPALALQTGGPVSVHMGGPFFNLAHSGGEAVFVFSSSTEVGVDIELEDPQNSHARVAERFFAPGEVQSLRSVPEELRARAFLYGWTRKEAFIKARGDGLSLPLDSFEVTLVPDEPPAVVRTAWSETEPTEWSVVDLSEPERGVIAAAAGRASGWRVVRRGVDELS